MTMFRAGVFLLLFALFFSSCHTVQNIPYFTDLPTTINDTLDAGTFTDPVIGPDDLMLINIQTLDPESNALFTKANTPVSAVGSSSAGITGEQMTGGYLVDKAGEVDIPVIGKTHLAGLTSMQARDTIKTRVERLYVSSTVQVKFANFKIVVLGEVNKPATYTVPNEKISVLDALGLAGDLTIYGVRDNVLLIREQGNKKIIAHLNLNSKNIISSPYFFLRQNDIIYVQPNESKIKSLDTYRFRNYTIAAAVLSVLIVAATRIK